MSAFRTMEQERAEDAWNRISKVKKKQKDYGSLARGLPAMIQINGLGQTLAFLMAKGKVKKANQRNPNLKETDEEHAVLYGQLSAWLGKKIEGRNDAEGEEKDFLGWLIQNNAGVYRRATNEAIAYAMWLRRFAEAHDWGDEQKSSLATTEIGEDEEGATIQEGGESDASG